MNPFTTLALFAVTALAELTGCFLVFRVVRLDKPVWLLPAALALGVFAWLLTLHPAGAGRTYAAYGGVYVAASVAWAWLVDERVDRWDAVGATVSLVGMAIIFFGPRE